MIIHRSKLYLYATEEKSHVKMFKIIYFYFYIDQFLCTRYLLSECVVAVYEVLYALSIVTIEYKCIVNRTIQLGTI